MTKLIVRRWRRAVLVGVVTLVIAPGVGCGEAAEPAAPLPDPVGHVVDVHARPWSTAMAPQVRVAAVDPPDPSLRKAAAVGTGGEAYIARRADPADPQAEAVYFVRNGQTYRVEGVPLPHRPLSGLAWASPRYLVFDRWSQPHHGMHYVVDVEALAVVHVTAFPDAFALSAQGLGGESPARAPAERGGER